MPRWLAGVTVALVLPLVAGALLLTRSPDGSGETGETDVLVTSLAEAPRVSETAPAAGRVSLRTESTILGRGGTLAAALDRLGVGSELHIPLVRAIGTEVDLRRLTDRAGVAAVWNDGDELVRLALREDTDRFLEVTLDPADATAPPRLSWIELPVVTDVGLAGGVVESSVSQALSIAPHGPTLTAAFADALQWDVDLLVDPRKGDVVRLVYESRRRGPLPDGLPPFRGVDDAEGAPLAPGRILAARYEGAVASAQAFWLEENGGGSYFDAEGTPMRKTFLKSPLNYRRISSGFSRARRHPVTRKVVPHHGVDFAAPTGTPVSATADGKVIATGWDGALGRAIRIRHGSEYITVYGHLSRIHSGIRPGTAVKQNQVIGYVGSTGRATGPHLHYTVIHGGRPINPMRMKNPPSRPLEPERLPDLLRARQRWEPELDAIWIADLADPPAGRGFFGLAPPAGPGA